MRFDKLPSHQQDFVMHAVVNALHQLGLGAEITSENMNAEWERLRGLELRALTDAPDPWTAELRKIHDATTEPLRLFEEQYQRDRLAELERERNAWPLPPARPPLPVDTEFVPPNPYQELDKLKERK